MIEETRLYDVIFIADMSRSSDLGLRLRKEIETCYSAGYDLGLRHLSAPGQSRPILPDIEICRAAGLAEVIVDEVQCRARLAIVYSPGYLKDPATGLEGINAETVVLVHDRPPNADQMGIWFSFAIGHMIWAPTNRWVRAKLTSLAFPVPLLEDDWRSIARPPLARASTHKPDPVPVIGRVSAVSAAQWPKTYKEIEAIYPISKTIDFRSVGAPPSGIMKGTVAAKHWTTFGFADMPLDTFVSRLDAVLYMPGAMTPELPETVIATAMAAGKIVALPEHLAPHFGPGALYCAPEDALERIIALLEDPEALAEYRALTQNEVRYQFSEEDYLSRIERLTGKPRAKRRRARSTRRGATALFVPSNGLGMGHTSRLLAIARRLDDRFEPTFASLGQVTGVIESFGYHAQYIPSHRDVSSSQDDWDAWLQAELGAIIAQQRPQMIVFDGNHPSDGLVRAAMRDGSCRLAWVRRGMAAQKPSRYLRNSPQFDCIIEPGEFATQYDTGPLVARRYEVHQVAPIRLLDTDELLSREEARAQLGLDPSRPATLLHLGSGSNFDLIDLIERILETLRRFTDLQIVVAEWANGADQMPRWDDVKILRGFPISQLFNAFDFSIAAAGYNTYHETMTFALPTIFIADRNPAMDDQGARAEFAQDHTLGFNLLEEEMSLLPALVDALMQPASNDFIRSQCATLDLTNGAEAAASLLEQMVEKT